MKVMVDGFNLALAQGTGVATYARNLTHNLKALGHEVHVIYGMNAAQDRSAVMREIGFYDEPGGARRFESVRRVSDLISPLFRPVTAYQIPVSGLVINREFAPKMPNFDKLWNAPKLFDRAHRTFGYFRRWSSVNPASPIQIMHWTYPLPLRLNGAKNVYTLHDLVPLRLPYTTLDNKRFYLKLMTAIARKSDHIVTVSETSKQDIMALLKVPESKVTNTYQAVDIPSSYLDRSIEELKGELKGSFGLQYKNYLLCYGAIEPKKNVGRIIEAYLAGNVGKPLVIAGSTGWKSDQELRLLSGVEGERLLKRRTIIRLPYLSFVQLVNLIRGATAVLFPSLYEGFGLPILEGMMCGTPVITSNLGSMKEIAGDAALLVDPYNTRDIKEAIMALVSNSPLQSEKSALGYKVAACYSNERYRDRLKSLYETIAGCSEDARFADTTSAKKVDVPGRSRELESS
jgi:glycosyltransferase involved in cell wall biosynthesis